MQLIIFVLMAFEMYITFGKILFFSQNVNFFLP